MGQPDWKFNQEPPKGFSCKEIPCYNEVTMSLYFIPQVEHSEQLQLQIFFGTLPK